MHRPPFVRSVALAALAIGAVSSTVARGDDDTSSAAAPPAARSAPKASNRCTVKYASGGTVRGVLLAGASWEKRDQAGDFVPAKRDERDAGLRLWYVDGADGFMFVAASRVSEVTLEGVFTDDDLRAMRRDVAAANARADAARKAAAADKAARSADKGPPTKPTDASAEQPEATKPAEATSVETDTVPAPTRARWNALLAKFPTPKWTPESPSEIRHQWIINHIPMTPAQREFVGAYDEWLAAYNDAKATAEKAKAAPVAPATADTAPASGPTTPKAPKAR